MSGSLDRNPRGNAAADEPLAVARAAHPPVPERLLSAATSASGIPWSATHEFREALSEYVCVLQGDGLDVVQTIIAVKAAVARVSPSLREQSVKWSIEQYYVGAPRSSDPGSKPGPGGHDSSLT